MNPKLILPAIAVAIFIAGLFFATLWQPTRQVRLHQRNFLKAVENRSWERASQFIAESYSDRWGHDKAVVLRESREVFRQFFAVTILQEERELRIDSRAGVISARLNITGTGGPLAQFAIQRVNALVEPFTFSWQQQSWRPWDWQLVQVDQPELELPE